jgi:D-methionine transport system ATP-binding protein
LSISTLTTKSAILRLQNVSLKANLGAQLLLQEISCEVGVGDRIAIIGPSGAGKTSLLRLLNRLYDATQGKIYLNDRELCQIPVQQVRQQVTLVLQESKLLGMTVRESLKYPLQLRHLNDSTIQQRLSIWMEKLHLSSDWLDRTEVQLSLGQRQLVAIARALAIQPQVLLLDEPTSALDAGRANHVLHVLTELAQTHQTTILMVNHQLELAQQFANRVFYLDTGKLLMDLSTSHVDWEHLRKTLIQAELRVSQEWE